jgi:hypothetical protein
VECPRLREAWYGGRKNHEDPTGTSRVTIKPVATPGAGLERFCAEKITVGDRKLKVKRVPGVVLSAIHAKYLHMR